MSTFNGIVPEFPGISIDRFTQMEGHSPPLACFLSHVHSDHLGGLLNYRSPFIYCSAATRQMLLRLEKWPHRMNFARGILESRKQTYKKLGKLLRIIPLNTPTEIEISPGYVVHVTLFDANHCTGAVMFLIEGQGKAILYTGDVRSEPWWVDNLIRHPMMLPYAAGAKRLDNIYLDTTFATKEDPHMYFPPKADGLVEMLQKVSGIPMALCSTSTPGPLVTRSVGWLCRITSRAGYTLMTIDMGYIRTSATLWTAIGSRRLLLLGFDSVTQIIKVAW